MTAVFALFLVALVLVQCVIATTTLVWMLDAWRTPEALDATLFPPPDEPRLSFSLIVPARHEEAVLADTLEGLANLDHPSYEVLVVIGHDDPMTELVAWDATDRHPDRIRVVIDKNWPKNKPKALNSALPECRGEIVGVFDAEDEVAVGLLRHVDACFRANSADVVQGGVQLMNFQDSWWSAHNVLEYFFWFRSRLHFHARQRFIPLGGNTVFVRREILQQVGGWDPDCLAEDCELGVRLSVRGAKVAVAYEAELVTKEETPESVGALFRQRTRWHQGFLQVLRKGVWRKLPSLRQRILACYTLMMPILQTWVVASIPLSLLLACFVDLPVGVAMLAFVPLLPLMATAAVQTIGLGEFGRTYGPRARVRDYAGLLLGMWPYQLILGAAAIRATRRELRGVNTWEKTEHVGAHRPHRTYGEVVV